MFTTIFAVRARRLQLVITALSKAFNHAKEMEAEAQCSVPKPRLVCMRDVSSVANKDYFPRCTVIHQCSPSVGCCNASSECSPVNTSIITRHFLVSVHQLLLLLVIRYNAIVLSSNNTNTLGVLFSCYLGITKIIPIN